MTNDNNPVLYFDGVCNLCNRTVQYIIKHDDAAQFRFASLQSDAGARVKEEYRQLHGNLPDSLLLCYEGKLYSKSDGALRTAIVLGQWRLLSKVLLGIPRGIRNVVYDLVARNRYKWFGKKDECMVPTEALKSRFLS